jgi:esterase
MKLNYQQYSSVGPPLLMLHGLFGNLSNLAWHSKKLAEEFAVYGVDLRNHGGSPHDDALSYQLMAEDVRELIAELNIESCYVLGHSMGGKVAMQLALNCPTLIEKMVVVDIAPVTYPEKTDDHLNILEGMDAVDAGQVKSRIEAEEILKDYINDESIRKFILTNLLRNKEGLYSWRLNTAAIRHNYDEIRIAPVAEGDFLKPVLFVKGGLSDYIQAKNEAEIVKLFPAASVKTIMQAGHWPHAEKPQVLQRIVSNFLRE